ncbi:hypothetical protein K435DRAFT_139767 [Dendrothele bispora CBS 962.96]|uniref:Uncharacterized protein n=1 Tax=Dendrothele bispora (strain CBS 962.96) TaxID=1314807 RepID=A0A4S8M0Z2_DENBC|nr:hypothetical protein K435DRAFT_139767 [Dendrothele bispora CBS 962.96]
MPPNPSTSATASASYQLPDLLSLVRKIELRTNRHCRPVTLASEKWYSEELWEGFRNVEDGNGNMEKELILMRCLVDPRGRQGRGGRGDEGEKEQGKRPGKGRASTSHSLDLTISQMKIGLLASIYLPSLLPTPSLALLPLSSPKNPNNNNHVSISSPSKSETLPSFQFGKGRFSWGPSTSSSASNSNPSVDIRVVGI